MSWREVADLYRTDDVQVMTTRQAKLNFEEPQTHQDGAMTWLRTSKVPLLDAMGQVIGVLGTYEDITEQQEAQQALIAARNAADRANQAKSEFLSSMSHELRTPMNAILGFGQLMEIDDKLPAGHLDSVREIIKAGHHLLGLINEVLELAKIESGHFNLSLEPVEVCPILQECLSLVSTLADKRSIRIRQLSPEGVTVRADRTRLKQALLNLLSNAVKYNRDGGSVTLGIQPAGEDRLRIRVTDSGPGVPAGRMEELFQPFNRLGAENSNIEGAGIGLTITQRIVEMMGGTLGVESTPGVGSSFWIELPNAPLNEGNAEGADAEQPALPALPSLSGEAVQQTVLYIDDTPSNLKLVEQILGMRPHIRLLTAHTPALGINLALEHHPDLILLDINLPGMDGYQVQQVLKGHAELEAIPIIAITANAMQRDIEQGMAAGFSEYLTKPINVAVFLKLLDQYLSDRSQT